MHTLVVPIGDNFVERDGERVFLSTPGLPADSLRHESRAPLLGPRSRVLIAGPGTSRREATDKGAGKAELGITGTPGTSGPRGKPGAKWAFAGTGNLRLPGTYEHALLANCPRALTLSSPHGQRGEPRHWPTPPEVERFGGSV